ncbi:PEBP family protein [Salinibacterium sp. NYA9b]
MSQQARSTLIAGVAAASLLVLAGCSNTSAEVSESTSSVPSSTSVPSDSVAEEQTFTADVWADNWFALYVNGELVGEDSVPITTERSFNKETITFTASYPLTIAIEAKDFKETDSGLEYIGEPNQQMGDGGLIAQVTDDAGSVVAVTNSSWSSLVTQRAPLDTSCENSSAPDVECTFTETEADADWFTDGYDSTSWNFASEFTAAEVGPKDGYTEVAWDASAQLIWADSLTQDNTILFRTVVESP